LFFKGGPGPIGHRPRLFKLAEDITDNLVISDLQYPASISIPPSTSPVCFIKLFA